MGCTLAGPFLYEDELPFHNTFRGSQDEREHMNARSETKETTKDGFSARLRIARKISAMYFDYYN